MTGENKISAPSPRLRSVCDRRQFLKGAAGTVAGAMGFPYIVSSSALVKAGSVAPSERITMGCIGVGWQGGSNMNSFLGEKDCQIVAVCDVDKNHLQSAVNRVNKQYKNKDCVCLLYTSPSPRD